MGSFLGGKPSKSTYKIYEPDTSVEARKELQRRGNVPSSELPLQDVALLSPLENYIQQMTQKYVESQTPNTYQNAIDLASKTANEPTDIMSLPEVQGLMQQINAAGSRESNRLGRTLQLSGGASSSKGRDVLGRNVTDVQNQMASSMSNFLNAERARKLQATGMMSDLQSAQINDLLQKINAGNAVGSLPRQIQQQGMNAKYQQQMMPYTTQAQLLNAILTNPQVLTQNTGGSQSGFSQIAPLIGPGIGLLGGMFGGGGDSGGGFGSMLGGLGGLFGGGAGAAAGAGAGSAASMLPGMFGTLAPMAAMGMI